MASINSLIINIFICTCAFVVVHGEDYSWIPATAPTPAEQCMKHPKHYPGHCDMENLKEYICYRLVCAVKYKGRYFVTEIERAVDGTICGSSHVCRTGACEKVPREKLPKEEGSNAVIHCKNLFD